MTSLLVQVSVDAIMNITFVMIIIVFIIAANFEIGFLSACAGHRCMPFKSIAEGLVVDQSNVSNIKI